MNNSLIKKNAGMVMLVILVVVLILITKNPISSVFGAVTVKNALVGFRVFNTTGINLCLFNRGGTNKTAAYYWLQVPANNPAGTPFPPVLLVSGGFNPGVVAITKPTLSGYTNTIAGITHIPAPYPFAVSFISGSAGSTLTANSAPDQQPIINLIDMSPSYGNYPGVNLRIPPTSSPTLIANTASGFFGSDLYATGTSTIGKSLVIHNTFKIIDYSTFTDTGDNVGGNNYNNVTITGTGAGRLSRFILNNGVDNIIPGGLAANGTVNNVKVYSSRTAANAAGAFTTTYYIPPYIQISGSTALPPPNLSRPIYKLKYTSTSSTGLFTDIVDTSTSTKDFYYGPSTNPGVFTKINNDTELADRLKGTISLIIDPALGTITPNVTTPTPYEIRYVDTIKAGSIIPSLTFDYIALSGTGNSATYTAAGTNNTTVNSNNGDINPPFIPYVVVVPTDVTMNDGTTTYAKGTPKTIFRSINNTTGNDIKYVSTMGTTSIPVVNNLIPNARRSV